jgi:ADP-heptose:LPS heptosyltransferase
MDNRRLLVVHQGSLGDFVVTFPAITRLRNLFSRVDALCQGKLGKMASDLGLIDGFHSFDSGCFASLYTGSAEVRVTDILRRYHDIVLFSFSAELEKAVGKCSTAQVYRIPPRATASQSIHATEHILRRLAGSGLLDISYGEFDRIYDAEDYTDRREPGYNPAKILIHPGSGSRKKNWPVSNFIKLERLLRSTRLNPAFILGPAERDMATVLLGHSVDQGRVPVMDDLSEVVSLLKISGGFVGNDSGLAHLSAFVGVPTVAIFGPSDPERWRPLGRAVRIVSPTNHCSPCFETDPEHCTHKECLCSISPELVKEAFFSVYPC